MYLRMSLSITLSFGVTNISKQNNWEKQVKRIKTVPENFRHIRLSKTLHEVEGYTFIVFHMVS